MAVYRDRERSVPRYNDFRRGMLQIPISKWEDLTDDEEAIKTLGEVYDDDIEELDLLVGLMAEKKIKGFAISETAFNIFLLMAIRFVTKTITFYALLLYFFLHNQMTFEFTGG